MTGIVYAVFLCTVASHGFIASTCARVMGKLQTVFVVMNFILIFATIIALPIGQKHRNSASFIFTHVENGTTWPAGWAFMISWLSPIWTIGVSPDKFPNDRTAFIGLSWRIVYHEIH